ncbi:MULTISPECIES: LysR substrate-binding domain-containing protein [unclassified Caballeronia]|uniref:LysR substrate-binding domain-containing protein n=1 Tax=unclassified Caballeronia TaxID=2646786 RepID=UPI001F49D453|nr:MULTISPECIES: LysR substrate-binding domain-containing protein [unclassified Caballeronia]
MRKIGGAHDGKEAQIDSTHDGMRKHRLRLPPLNAVKAFESVARLGSLAQAAHELNVTPSAVSQQIKTLEDYIGRRLFVQRKQRLDLTETSRMAVADISHALDLIMRAFQPKEERTSRVAVSALPAFASRWLNPRLPAFLKGNPEIELYVDGSQRLVDFSNESFDMAFRFGAGKYETLSADLLFKERFQAVCAPSVKREIEEFIAQGRLNKICFILDVGMRSGEQVTWDDWFERRGFPPITLERKMVCTDANASIEAAVSGCGLLLGRHLLIGNLLEQGALTPLDEYSFETELGYFLVYPSFVGLSPMARALRDWVLSQAVQTHQKLDRLAGY